MKAAVGMAATDHHAREEEAASGKGAVESHNDLTRTQRRVLIPAILARFFHRATVSGVGCGSRGLSNRAIVSRGFLLDRARAKRIVGAMDRPGHRELHRARSRTVGTRLQRQSLIEVSVNRQPVASVSP